MLFMNTMIFSISLHEQNENVFGPEFRELPKGSRSGFWYHPFGHGVIGAAGAWALMAELGSSYPMYQFVDHGYRDGELSVDRAVHGSFGTIC